MTVCPQLDDDERQSGFWPDIVRARYFSKCLKSLVACAVICKPVSTEIPPLSGNLTGNFVISGFFETKYA